MPFFSPKKWLGQRLARYPSKQRLGTPSIALCQPEALRNSLRKGDVLLVEGNTRFSLAIQYLTQSNWSHSALCIKDPTDCAPDEPCLVEADILRVCATTLDKYSLIPTRICRPVGLHDDEVNQVINLILNKLGYQYDLQKVSDLVRYLMPKPPVPESWRRRLISFGSGDPNLCDLFDLYHGLFSGALSNSTAYQSRTKNTYARNYHSTVTLICKHSLYTPRDFDISPYFQIIKSMN